MKARARIAVLATALCWIAGPAAAQQCPDYNPDRNPYFGDTHVHTAFSFDAVLLGVQAEPSDAYAFAKGAAMTLAPAGRNLTGAATMTQLARPLDFTAVTDHSEFFGEFHVCTVPPADPSDPDAAYNSEFCADYRGISFGNRNVLTTPGPEISQRTFRNFAVPLLDEFPERHPFCRDNPDCVTSTNLIWQETQDAAQLANDPCTFSAFNAYEWTKVRPRRPDDVGGESCTATSSSGVTPYPRARSPFSRSRKSSCSGSDSGRNAAMPARAATCSRSRTTRIRARAARSSRLHRRAAGRGSPSSRIGRSPRKTPRSARPSSPSSRSCRARAPRSAASSCCPTAASRTWAATSCATSSRRTRD